MSDFIYLSYVFDLGESKNDTHPAARGTETPYFGVFLKKWTILPTFTHYFFDKSAIFSPIKKKKKGFLCLEILQRAALVL